MTRQQYIDAGNVHTKNDQEIKWPQVKSLQNRVNSMVWWLSRVLNHSEMTDPKRMDRNTQDHNSEVAEMYILLKDHKKWDSNSKQPVPCRPVVSGNGTYNVHLSELLSELLEPVAKEMCGAEIASTEDALHQITNINDWIEQGKNLDELDGLNLVNKKYTFRDEDNTNDTFNITNEVSFGKNINNLSVSDTSLVNLLAELIEERDTDTDKNGEDTILSSLDSTRRNFVGTTDTVDITPEDSVHVDPTSNNDLKDIASSSSDVLLSPVGNSDGTNNTNLCVVEDISSAPIDDVCVEEDMPVAPIEDVCVEEDMSLAPIDDGCGAVKKTKIDHYFKTSDCKNDFNQDTRWWESMTKECKMKAQRATTFTEEIEYETKASDYWSMVHEARLNKILDADTVANRVGPELQDTTAPPTMIGGDVIALYPSMESSQTAAIAGEAVLQSSLEFTNINYTYALVLLLLIVGKSWMYKMGLGEFIPTRNTEAINARKHEGEFNCKNNQGNPRSLNASINRKMSMWSFRGGTLTHAQKRRILSKIVQIATLVLMNTHSYSFTGKLYKQRRGAPIGLRASACLAKILMSTWDSKWAKIQNKLCLKIFLFYRYVDDIRVYLQPLVPGWRWSECGWIWTNDQTVDPIENTKAEIGRSFEYIFKFLGFTTECQDDYSNGMLPTLDFMTRTLPNGQISFEYFSKDMVNNRMLDFKTALSKGTIFSALRQNLVRRLLNTGTMVDQATRLGII